MLTGEIRSKIDALWNAFWTGGISNPLEVIEQITYLLFLKRLDDLHTLEENKATRLKLKNLEPHVFPAGKDPKGRPYADLRWSRFKHFEAKEMFEVVNDHVFPFLRTLGGDDFRAKARHFLRAHESDLVIHKLRMNQPLTAMDLAELEKMLTESGETNPDHVQKAKAESDGLGLFVRSLVGLDREAAK